MTAQSVLDVLRAAREKIATPERWTKGAAARDVNGGKVDAASPLAVCWCANGAIYSKPSPYLRPGLRDSATENLRMLLPIGFYVSTFNDAPTTTHADILALFDRAIAAEEKQ